MMCVIENFLLELCCNCSEFIEEECYEVVDIDFLFLYKLENG